MTFKMSTSLVFLIINLINLSSVLISPVSGQDVTVSDETISRLRNEMSAEFAAKPSLYDHIDVDRVLDRNGSFGDWHARRYLIWEDNSLSDALELMKKNFKWRHKLRINHLTGASWPCEFFDTAIVNVFRDRQNRPLLVYNMAVHGGYGTMSQDWYNFIWWSWDKVDLHAASEGWGMIPALGGINVGNLDPKGIHELFPVADRFPAGMHYVRIAGLSPFMAPPLNMILAALPGKLRRLVSTVDDVGLYKTARKRDLPDYLGGRQPPQRAMPMIEDAKNCISLRKMARIKGWDRDDVDGFMQSVGDAIQSNRRKTPKI